MTLDLYPKPRSAPSPTNPSLINDRSNFGEFWASSRRSFFFQTKNPLFWYRFLLQGPFVASSLPFHSLRVLSTLFFLTPSGRLGVWGAGGGPKHLRASLYHNKSGVRRGKGSCVGLLLHVCACVSVSGVCASFSARALLLLAGRTNGWMDGRDGCNGWMGRGQDGWKSTIETEIEVLGEQQQTRNGKRSSCISRLCNYVLGGIKYSCLITKCCPP